LARDKPQVMFGFLNKKGITELKKKAMRKGVWFKALTRIDRVLVELTLKVSICIRSHKLAKSILAVEKKLHEALENKLNLITQKIGYPAATMLSLLAAKWGHKSAWKWVNDAPFARYLAVMKLNG
jgi:hypothetical protein